MKVEAGPADTAPGVAALTGDGLVLPIGDTSAVVARFETVLTEHPVRTARLVRGATVGGSGAVNGGSSNSRARVSAHTARSAAIAMILSSSKFCKYFFVMAPLAFYSALARYPANFVHRSHQTACFLKTPGFSAGNQDDTA